MPDKLSRIESLLESVRDSGDLTREQKDARHGMIDNAVLACVTYHNEAVDQGRLITLQRFRMTEDEYIDYISRLHEKRKDLHRALIDQTAVLNRLFEEQGMEPIYKGPMDPEKGRKDSGTRFGVAEFAEEVCRDLFRTTHEYGVPAKARQAWMDHSDRVTKQGGSWSVLQKMLEQADARNRMASDHDQPER